MAMGCSSLSTELLHVSSSCQILISIHKFLSLNLYCYLCQMVVEDPLVLCSTFAIPSFCWAGNTLSLFCPLDSFKAGHFIALNSSTLKSPSIHHGLVVVGWCEAFVFVVPCLGFKGTSVGASFSSFRCHHCPHYFLPCII